MPKAKAKRKTVKKSGIKKSINVLAQSRNLIVVAIFVAVILIGIIIGMALMAGVNSRIIYVKSADDIAEKCDESSLTIEAVKKVSPSVVSIVITKELKKITNLTGPNTLFLDDYLEGLESGRQKVGMGTGFVVNSIKGLVLTNKHVVSDTEAEYTVITNSGQQLAAEVLDLDPFSDLAVLKIENGSLPAVELGDSNALENGQTVIAIGYSLGEYKNTVTKGVVSGINRRVVAGNYNTSEIIEDAIQIDAAINPGNSGGPLIDLSGKVVGISTAVNNSGQLLGFAIPINPAKEVINSIETTGRIVRPWIGVRYKMVNSALVKVNELSVDYGAMLIESSKGNDAVFSGSPAEVAGLKKGDIILELNGQKLTEKNHLGLVIKKYQAGDSVVLKILRGDKEMTIKLELGEYGL